MQVFFYGLFMDLQVLAENGIVPEKVEQASLTDYKLKIGERASLIPAKRNQSYGLLMTVDSASIENLYVEKSVADYIPEAVVVLTESNVNSKAICYNLPSSEIHGTNKEYAKKLLDLAIELNFPKDYLTSIKEFCF